MLARDCSNYTVELTDATLAQWIAEGVGLLIIQAFPASYAQYQEQQRQVAAAVRNGLPFDHYIYDYLGDPTWVWDALEGIKAQAAQPRMVWLDEEDVETDNGATDDASKAYRAQLIWSRVQHVRDSGYPVGIYTGSWWWTPRVGAVDYLAELPLWAAQYDGIADTRVFTPFGGWTTCAVKQYAGTQGDGTDLNVVSEEVMADCQAYRDALERVVNRIQIELERKTASGRAGSLRRTIFREIASEAFGALQS